MLKLKPVKENFSSIDPQGGESKAHKLWKWLMDNGSKSREEIYQFDKSYSTVLAKYLRNGLIKQDNDLFSAVPNYKFEDVKLIDNGTSSDKENISVKKVHSKFPTKIIKNGVKFNIYKSNNADNESSLEMLNKYNSKLERLIDIIFSGGEPRKNSYDIIVDESPIVDFYSLRLGPFQFGGPAYHLQKFDLSKDLNSQVNREIKNKYIKINPDNSIEKSAIKDIDRDQLEEWLYDTKGKKSFGMSCKFYYGNNSETPVGIMASHREQYHSEYIYWDFKSGQFFIQRESGGYGRNDSYYKLNKTIKPKTLSEVKNGIDLIESTLRLMMQYDDREAGAISIDRNIGSKYFI